jgi:hypothetical protein
MDYDFSRLSTRSFEQLIQSLSHSVIGPSIVIFGDGPDGGREATFEGQIPFPNDETPWHGYGVIQAKFKQRTEGSGTDGDWALNELKKELEKFESPIRGLKKPEYYIFVTNVVLTPVAESGRKDKLTNYLKSQKTKLGLKDFRIWDYDQLRVMLDGCTDVRTSYSAWITAGDVLAKLIESIQPKGPDFREIMRNYLQKELCADQYVNLNQAGHQPKDRIPLAQVFVDLPVGDQSQPKGAVELLLEMTGWRLDPRSNQQGTLLTMGLSAVTPPPGRLVFIGGPGQGKTTLSQFICQLFRVSLLQQENQILLLREAKDACTIINDQISQAGLILPSMPRFPLRVVLNSFAAVLAEGNVTSLFDYLLQRINKLTDRNLTQDDLRSWLATYPWLLVLDGLDEVPASSNRDEVITAVQNFLVDAQGCNADLLLLATSRPQGYNDDFSHRYYQHYELLPLDVPRALNYADRLLEQRWGGDQDKIENLRRRLQRAGAEVATARLMRSPLQVTIMAMLVESVGQPPRERWRLFNDYYRVIYSREKQRDIPAAELLNTYQTDIDTIHQRVGLRLQIDSELSGATDALLMQNEFALLVQQRLEAEGHTGQDGEFLKQQIIDAAIERLVFLVAPQADKIGFEIRSLQEFMAAQCLMTGSDHEVQLRLRAIAPATHWRNVFLFAAGRCFFERQHLRDTLHALCHELNEGEGIQVGGELEQATLAGSRLALEMLEDGAMSKAPAQLKLYTNLALQLLELPPCAEQARLAKQYLPELSDTFQKVIKSRLADSVPERRFGAWRVLLQLQYQSEKWAQDLVIQAWPTNANEGIQIIKACDGINFSDWLGQKWLNTIPEASPINTHFGSEKNWNPSICSILDNNKIWPNFIWRFKEERELKISISGVDGDFFNLKVNPISVETDSTLSNLPEISQASKEWRWLISTLNFGLNLNCSKEQLAELLLEFSSWTEEQRQSIGKMRNRLAWPILACIEESAESDELRRLAKAAQEGELGDRKDWINAQERWQSQGLTISDFHYVPQCKLPFDNQIAKLGFPFVLSAAMLTHSGTELSIAIQLFDFWQSLSPSLAKKRVTQDVLFAMSCEGDQGVVWDTLKIDDFKELLANRPNDHLYWSLLAAVPTSFWEHSEFVSILENVGCDSFIIYGKPKRDFVPYLEKLVVQYPNNGGLLRLLAIACLIGHRPCSTVKINLGSFSGHRERLAALTIRIAQADWHENEATQLAEAIMQLDKLCSSGVDSSLKIIKLQKLSGRYVELFLNRLFAILPCNEWEQRQDVFQAMLDQQRHRRAETTKLAV